MTSLVGKALEEDEDFWGGIGNDFFGGGESDDDDFNSKDESDSAA